MECFKCHVNLINCKSKYGFYYYCPRCGKTFETSSQTNFNKRFDKSHLNTFTDKKEAE